MNTSDPGTYWLIVTNIGLALVVLIGLGAVAVGVLQELHAKHKKKAELADLDRELRDLVAGFQDGHAFDLPGLGLTMADGGEDVKEDPKKKDR